MRRMLALMAVLLMAGCLSGSDPDGDPDDGTPPTGVTPADTERPTDAALAQTGRWLAPFDGQVPAVNMVLLNNGRVLYWSGVEANPEDSTLQLDFFTAQPMNATSRVLDLSSGVPVILEPLNPEGAGADLFCAGQTLLPDGRVLAVGSSVWSTNPLQELFLHGGTDARIYDPATNAWERKADMTFGRWYPTVITLPDGQALVASGIGSLSNPLEQWPQMEVYDPAADTWTYVSGGDRLLPLYPRLTVIPDTAATGAGVFYNTVGTMWGPFGEHPRQLEWSTQAFLPLGSAWRNEANSIFGGRQHASSIMTMLEPGQAPRFINFGGSLYQLVVATPFAESVDLSTDPPTNTLLPAMSSPRWHLNSLLLPTGDVLAVGGGLYDNVVVHGQQNIPVLTSELFDPDSNTWTTLDAMSVPRMYHSTAVLLPDGRVLAGGHVPLPFPSPEIRGTLNPQVVETRLEIFEPPYLFRGPRPVITEAPTTATYGAAFDVVVQEPQKVADVVLMHPGSTTHAYDSSQRGLRLDWTLGTDGRLQVQGPADAYTAPPGDYMLFVLGQGNGGLVPSVASWVHVA